MSINDFEIIKQLGKGAFSTVSLVRRKQDNKIYALKCVQISKLSVHERQNSLNEVRLLASINHKNIISYKESFYNEKNQTLNIILEYADDGDLQTKIISKKSSDNYFEEKTIWSIFIQMVKGLNELHNKKIIHRDLKSANIFLMKNGTCKLGDLNVSKVVENELLRTQTGTPFFASPEIWEDKPYSFKSDIWSIGCILYQMAALKMPFQGKSIKEVYHNLKNVNIPPLPENYSDDLMIMIKKLLKLDPEERPSTKEILDDEIIKNKMKIMFQNDNDLIDISMDVNNFQKFKNKKLNNGLIKSIRIHDDKNLNYILPKKNYDESDNLIDISNENDNNEIQILFSNRNKEYKFDNIKKEKIIKQNFSFNEEEKEKNKKYAKNKFSLINLEEKYLPKINKNDKKLPKLNGKTAKRQCNSAKIGRNLTTNNTLKEYKVKDNKKNLEINYQFKKITPINTNKKIIYINYNQMSDLSLDEEPHKNYGTAEETLVKNDSLNSKNRIKNKINNLKRVNSFLLTNKKQINSLKQNKISKNNSQYSFPLVNQKEYHNQRKSNKKIKLEYILDEVNIKKKDKNNNMTLDLNNEIKDILNINSCKNQKNKEINYKEKNIYNYNFNTEKGKKIIPNHPIKYGIPSFNTKELNKNQNYYYNSHNNLDQDNINANNDIVIKENNNNLIKKLFAKSPNHRIEDRIIIQNNNININNNFNIKKKYPFILNFNQKERNGSLENLNKMNKEKKDLFPIINNNNININNNKKELKLPKLSHVPVICLSNKVNDEEVSNNKNNMGENKEKFEIEPAKKMLLNPIKIIEKKDAKIKLLPINSQMRINKLNDINNNAYK